MNEQSNVSGDNYARPVGRSTLGAGQPMSHPRMEGRDLLTPAYVSGSDPIRRNKARGIQISQQDHGYIVNVGCQTLVFENMNTLIEKLTSYLKDPDAVEKKWMTEGIL